MSTSEGIRKYSQSLNNLMMQVVHKKIKKKKGGIEYLEATPLHMLSRIIRKYNCDNNSRI
jgi:hypothetical protein